MSIDIIKAKKDVFDVLVTAIDKAVKDNLGKVNIKKKIRVYGNLVNVVIDKEEYLPVLRKAEEFFSRTDDFEYCQMCKDIKEKIS